MSISVKAHAIAQVAALAIQYGNLASGVVPPAIQPYVALAVGIAQAVLAFVAHYSPVPNGAVKP